MAGFLVETCRGCLSTERASMMYSLYEDETRKLFSNCTRIKISDDADSLGQLCARCYEFCENWYTFKTTCWMNDQRRSYSDLGYLYDEPEDDDLHDPFYDDVAVKSEDFYNWYEEPVDSSLSTTTTQQMSLSKTDIGTASKMTAVPEDKLKNPINKDWKCIFCRKKHDSYNELRTHLIDQHINANKPQCRLCHSQFSSVQGTILHLIKVHMKKFDCPRCSKHLNSFVQFDVHMEEEHKERGYGYLGVGGEAELDTDWNCPVCNEQITQSSTLRSHMREHHLSKEDPLCPICGQPPNASKDIYPHIIRVHMRKYDCRTCTAKFSSGSALNDHILMHHKGGGDMKRKRPDEKKTETDDEDSGPPKKKLPKIVVKREHPNSSNFNIQGREKGIANGNWDCMVCQVRFTNYRMLRDHLQTEHIDQDNPACPICAKAISRSMNVVMHVVEIHMKKLECPICPYRSHSFKEFNVHGRLHHIGFDKNRDRWARVTGGQAPRALPKAPQAKFGASPAKLKVVSPVKSRVTSGGKKDFNWNNWDCLVCKKKFTQCSELRNHMYEMYILENDPKCPVCGKACSDTVNTFRHVLSIHMRKWDCPYCPKKVGSTAAFKTHLKWKHNIEL